MKKNIVISIMVSLTVLGTGCSKSEEESNKSIGEIQKEIGIPVEVHRVIEQNVAHIQKYSGELSGARQKGVYATLPEYIKSIPVTVGEYVKKDQILAELDTDGVTPYYQQAKAAYEIAQKTYDRVKTVFENGGVSQQQLDEAETQYKVRRADFIATKKRAFVLAPFDGVIIDIFFKEGAVAISGKDEHPMMKIAQVHNMLMKINVSHSEIHNFKRGMKAKIKIGDAELQGKVTKVPLAASPVNRFFVVELLFNNPGMILKPGMFVQAEVTIEEATLPAIPLEAVQFEKKGTYVYKVIDGKAVKTVIETAIINDDFVGVAKGITAEDVVIVKGISKVSNGSKVNIL